MRTNMCCGLTPGIETNFDLKPARLRTVKSFASIHFINFENKFFMDIWNDCQKLSAQFYPTVSRAHPASGLRRRFIRPCFVFQLWCVLITDVRCEILWGAWVSAKRDRLPRQTPLWNKCKKWRKAVPKGNACSNTVAGTRGFVPPFYQQCLWECVLMEKCYKSIHLRTFWLHDQIMIKPSSQICKSDRKLGIAKVFYLGFNQVFKLGINKVFYLGFNQGF